MNKIFNKCVDLLEWSAEKTNLTYEQLNVILFVYLMPASYLTLIFLLISKKK